MSDESDDLLYEAWGIIANAHEGDWSKATPEWGRAAIRFRDKFHARLPDDELRDRREQQRRDRLGQFYEAACEAPDITDRG